MKILRNRFAPVMTPFGIINGRDGLYLAKVEFTHNLWQLVIYLFVNTKNCSKGKISDDSRLKLTFTGVLATKIIEIDSWDWNSASCIDEVKDSDWIVSLGGKITKEHRHYFVQTYDDVFDVVCTQMDMLLIKEEQAWF